MLRHILFDVEFFADESDRANSQKRVLCLLEALVWCNRLYLQQHPETPLIYQSGIKYKVPAQFEKEQLPEVDAVRGFLKKKGASDDVMRAFKTLEDMCGGGEHFREIPRIIENGGGDCLPIETLVQRRDGRVPIGELRDGDEICGLNGFVRVERVWPRSHKSTITLFLDSGAKLVSSGEHRHAYWKTERSINYIRADEVKVGDGLVRVSNFGLAAKVVAMEPTAPRECIDITTSSGTFWLPESDVLTHNCDNVAAWRVAELREKGIDAKPYITWRQRKDGGYTYHVTVLLPDGSSEDPSLLLGMGGVNRAPDRLREEQKLGERTAEFIEGIEQTGMIDEAIQRAFYRPRTAPPIDILGAVTRRNRERRALDALLGSVTSVQDFNQLQYSIPFQTDDELYEDWSPTRPQGFYNNPSYPNLPSTPGGVPMFNTILGGMHPSHRSQKKIARAVKRELRRRQ